MNDDTEDTKPAAMSAEQSADFAALQASAAGAGPAPGTPAAEEQQGPQQPSAEAMGVAGLLVAIIKPIASAGVAVLKDAPDELWAPVAEGVAGLLDHYGLAHEALAGPWARFGFAVAPLVGYVALARLNAPEPEKKPSAYQVPGQLPTPEPVPAASAAGVTFGAVIPA